MKKFLTAMVAGATLFTAASAFAATTVQVTLTSPTIIKSGCEKAGAVTFTFPTGSKISEGDWWYLDLPANNVTLCQTIDYVITSGASLLSAPFYTQFADASYANLDLTSNAAAALTLPAAIPFNATGPITFTSLNTGIEAGATVTAPLALRVYGAAGGRRVTITCVGDGLIPDVNGADGEVDNPATSWNETTTDPGYDPNATITVGDHNAMNIKILDGKGYNVHGGATNTMVLTNQGKHSTAPLEFTYGEALDSGYDVITKSVTTAAPVPALGNTLCIDATAYTSELIFVSFDSKEDKINFSGDSQIAHVGSAAAISLKSCKSPDLDQINISGQNSQCSFSYKYNNNYDCELQSLYNDNLIIQTSSQFGELGDKFDIAVTSLTNGVYFGADPKLETYLTATTLNPCTTAGDLTITPSFQKMVGGVISSTATYQTDGKCAIVSTKKINAVTTAYGAVSLDNKNVVRIDLPNMVYDTSVIGNGTEVKVTASLSKYPCGKLFEGTVTVGTFVTTCSTVTTTSSVLLFPFFPPMNPEAAPGWWGGYVVVNGGSKAGTADLRYSDANGAVSKFVTPSIPVGGQYNGSAITADQLTAVSGTFSEDQNYSIKAICGFDHAAGFAFLASPTAAASYTAYVDNSTYFQ